MKLVTQTENLSSRYGDVRAVEMLCKAGYDGIDYSMFMMRENPECVLNTDNYKIHVKRLLSIAEKYGVTFEQAHAPFPSAKRKDKEYSERMLETLKRSIEIAGLLDAKIIVVHPVDFHRHNFERNMELYHALESTARNSGVKIALENMWGRGRKDRIVPNVCSVAEEFNRFVDALDPTVFTACLDLGHCGLVGENAGKMIREMGNRIGCLHIHDNDNIHDSHTLPYTMNMDWDDIISALREIGYKGNFTYEADNFLRRFPDEFMPTAVKFMADLGRTMISKIEGN